MDVAKVWPRGMAIITCFFHIFVFSDISVAATSQGVTPIKFQAHPNTSMNKYGNHNT